MDLWVLIVGLVGTAVGLGLAGKRVVFLYRMITHGQPAPDRVAGVTGRIGLALRTQVVEVFGQKKLLKWTIPGTAHFFVFWAFIILGTVYVEAYYALISRELAPHFLFFGTFKPLGFLQDFIAVMCLLGLLAFWQIRMKNSPARLERRSRFFGSHLGGAYLVLFMIFNVIWTLFLFRGAVIAHELATGEEGYGKAAFVSYALGTVLPDSPTLIGIGLLLHIGIMLVFLVEVVNSKHLHIFLAPLNVLFSRRPVALGAIKPLMNDGKPVTLDDIEDLDEETTLGVGSIEDFSWKGLLDFSTCTECGRCQSQCPAWNTEKPLSPKMLIMNLRDHALAKTPYLLAAEGERDKLPADVLAAAERPLVGETEGYAWEPEGGAIIDTDVLWSCVTCGACVNQCPVDIEHVDHIIDMRRYQVLVENNFPAELNQLFKGMEGKGNPWNMSASMRMDWAKDLPFEVKVVGEQVESLSEVEWLFWVGCAGAYEDRAKKTTRAVAELLDMAGVSFAVLGNGETCTGDSARRAGNEFLFQQLATQNIESFKEHGATKVVSTCAHCFNTLKNEYSELGIELEVVHHTQLLNRLVREGKLTPVKDGAGAAKRSITYHDPCYIGRHNGVYSPPRELLQILPGAELVEMERNSERSFCCGAGGARMWMEETIGERINVNRTNEAIGTGADQIAVGCPFCRVMLSDGLTAAQADGTAREEVEVLDVAQMLLASVKGQPATRQRAAANGAAAPERSVETKAEPDAGDVTQSASTVTETEDVGPAAKASGGSSLFDTPADDTADDAAKEASAQPATGSGASLFDTPAPDAATTDEPPAKPAAASGGSLFDLSAGDSTGSEASGSEDSDAGHSIDKDEMAEKAATEAAPAEAEPSVELGSGSLFGIEDGQADDAAAAAADNDDDGTNEVASESSPAATTEPTSEATSLDTSGSLFDIAPADEAPADGKAEAPAAAPESASESAAEPKQASEPVAAEAAPDKAAPAAESDHAPAADLGSGGSLFDLAAPEAVEPEPAQASEPAAAATPDEPELEPEPAADESESEEPESEKPKPASPGPSNQPKTDVNISEGGSLFDL